MKGFLIIAICVVVVTAYGGYRDILKECTEKELTNAAQRGELYKPWKGNFDDPEVDSKLKCLIACVLETLKIMTPDGFSASYYENNLKRSLEDDDERLNKGKLAFDECVGKVKSTERCDRATEFMKCLRPKLTEIGIRLDTNTNVRPE